MSTTASSSAVLRKKQDEKNSKILRDLLAIPANKFCFECGQRGPTYVNITNCSFCCMHCSGLLRGLNPPHRVKSISMSTFTDEEIERLEASGNEPNGRIWLGLYDKKVKFEPRVDDEVRQHLIQKYECRRWYVSPDDLAQQKKLLEEHLAQQKMLLSGQQRRDSISSHKSHQSNQSAPPNLHPKEKQDLFDLLSGDFPPAQALSSVATTLNGFQTVSSTSNAFGVFTTTNIAAPSSITTLTTQIFNPLTHSSVPNALRHRIHPQYFNSTEAISAARNDSRSVPNTLSTSALFDSSFADFDTKFESLNISQQQNVPNSTTLADVASNNSQQPQHQRHLTQSNSMFTSAATSSPLTTAANVGATSTFQTQSIIHTPTSFNGFQNKMEHRSGMTKEGKPIMSTPTTLPDYSALEELFRGSSVDNGGISTMAPSCVSSGDTVYQINNFNASTNLTPACGTSQTVSKSNTTGGFADHNDGSAHYNQFYSMSNFPTNSLQHVRQGESAPDVQNSVPFTTNPAKNWNPFAS